MRRAGPLILLSALAAACDGGSGEDPGDGTRDAGSTRSDAGRDGGAGAPRDAGFGDAGAGRDSGTFVAPDPATLRWERLPDLAGTRALNAGQAHIALGDGDSIFVALTTAQAPAWTAPWELVVYRWDEVSGWVLMGDGPIVSGDAAPTPLGIAIDEPGAPVVAYHVAGESYLVRLEGQTWSPVDLDAEVTGERITRLDGDDRGHPIAAARIGTDQVQIYRVDHGAWTRLGDTFTSTAGAEISGGPNGRVVLALGRTVHLFEGGAWRTLGTLTTPRPIFLDAAVGPLGRPVVTWREDGANGTLLYAARFDPTSNSFESLGDTIQIEGPGGSYSIVAIDPAGTPFVTWRESTVYVAQYTTGAWQPYVAGGRAEPAGRRGTLPDLAFGRTGLPVVVWEALDEARNGHVVVSRAVPKTPFNRYAVRLDGTAAHVVLGRAADVLDTSGGPFSLSLWVKLDGVPPGDGLSGDGLVFIDGSVGFGQGLDLIWSTENPEPSIAFYGPGSPAIRGTPAVPTIWNQVTIVYDPTAASSHAKLYLNGALMAEADAPNGMIEGTGDVWIGKWLNDNFAMKGWIDEVAVWDTALDETTVLDIYGGGTPTDLSATPSLTGYWRMGDDVGGIGTTSTDLAGDNDAQLLSGALFEETAP